MAMSSLSICLLGAALELCAVVAHGEVLRVPGEYSTIQAAVNAARPFDTIRVARGVYCGARVQKPVRLVGQDRPSIVGCDEGPALGSGLHVGFWLSGSGGSGDASGSRITGFAFEGRGISNDDKTPLALGVLGRFVSDVVVDHDEFLGTVQAVTNTAGDRWVVEENEIRELAILDCSGACAGGAGIVVQVARGWLSGSGGAADPRNRPEQNRITHNLVEGLAPRDLDAFAMVGILVLSADDTIVERNVVELVAAHGSARAPEAVRLTHLCCGGHTELLPGTRGAQILGNEAHHGGLAVVVEGSAGENTHGLLISDNVGGQILPAPGWEAPQTLSGQPPDDLEPVQ